MISPSMANPIGDPHSKPHAPKTSTPAGRRLTSTSSVESRSRDFARWNQRLRDRGADRAAQGADRFALVHRMDRVGQQDDERVVVRVDPQARSGEPGVPKALALGEPLAAGGGVAGVDVEAV